MTAQASWTAQLKNQIAGISWPSIATGRNAQLIALLHQLEQTERLPLADLQARQAAQLLMLTRHAIRHSLFFRERMAAAGIMPRHLCEPDGLRRLPPLTRRALQGAKEKLFCDVLPEGHAPTGKTSTSGSSGEPVVIRRTAINQLMWLALTLRDHFWQQRDFSGRLAIIRAGGNPDGTDNPDWGAPVTLLFESGTMHQLPINLDVKVQAAWLQKINPHYLLTYPTNIAALLDEFAVSGKPPALRQLRSIGETLTPALRERVSKELGIEVSDVYSSQEVGNIALQCPHSGLYHIMSESLIVEVLDQDDQPCAPGETGRVVITDLLNYATPLIRYEIGDYAEVGPLVCPCGRGLPTLRRIMGRERNMLRHPGGQRYWPLVGFDSYRAIAPVRQYQLIQTSITEIEVRFVVDGELSAAQEVELSSVINNALGYPFTLKFVYFPNALPRSAGGKFEEFVCQVR